MMSQCSAGDCTTWMCYFLGTNGVGALHLALGWINTDLLMGTVRHPVSEQSPRSRTVHPALRHFSRERSCHSEHPALTPRRSTRHTGTMKTGQVWKWNKQEIYIVSQTTRIEMMYTSPPLFFTADWGHCRIGYMTLAWRLCYERLHRRPLKKILVYNSIVAFSYLQIRPFHKE